MSWVNAKPQKAITQSEVSHFTASNMPCLHSTKPVYLGGGALVYDRHTVYRCNQASIQVTHVERERRDRWCNIVNLHWWHQLAMTFNYNHTRTQAHRNSTGSLSSVCNIHKHSRDISGQAEVCSSNNKPMFPKQLSNACLLVRQLECYFFKLNICPRYINSNALWLMRMQSGARTHNIVYVTTYLTFVIKLFFQNSW